MQGRTEIGIALAAWLLLAVSPAVAGKDIGKGKQAAEDTERPFIERSLVLVPEQVGPYQLVTANDYPGQPELGVGLRYRHEAFPEVRLDLFVYPVGRIERDPALAQVLKEVREGVAGGVDQGVYANVEMGEESGLDLGRVDDDGALLPTDVARGDPEADASPDSILAAIGPAVGVTSDWRSGRRLTLRLDYRGEPQDSMAFAFYRGLYLFKGRISASPVEVPTENLERLGQHAMATLIPAVQVRNTGGCHRRVVTVDPALTGDEAGEELAKQVLRSGLLAEDEGCAETLDESVPDGYRALPLVFDPASWREAP